MTELDVFLARLPSFAEARGGRLADLDPRKVAERFHETDAALFNRGLRQGLLRIDSKGYLHSADPRQTTAWMVEGGDRAWPCWEYLPHGAAYVELITVLGFPVTTVRFETPGREHDLDLDLAVVHGDGLVSIVGEAKKTRRELDQLVAAMQQHLAAECGPPVGVSGMAKAAWKLTHRLWATRADWLWLVGPSERRTFAVAYGDSITLSARPSLPTPAAIGLGIGPAEHPAIALPGERAAAGAGPWL